MSRLEDKFDKTISEYNENVSDFHKFKFSQKEKELFQNMMREYAEECVKASLEKASENSELISYYMDVNSNWQLITNGNFQFDCNNFTQKYDIKKESITNPENIVLL